MEATFHDGTTITVHDVIVLARKSQKIKGRSQTSIESQDKDARYWAEDLGLNVVATVPDIESGTKAMWNRTHAKPWVTQSELMVKYQAIVASKYDRLSRADMADESELREWAEKNHIALFLVEKDLRYPPRPGAQYNDDWDGWTKAANDANREWNNTSRRWKRSHKERADNNQLSGKAPFGYRITGIDCGESPCRCFERGIDDPKTLTIYEPEAKIVREVVNRYLSGESTESICKDYPRWVPASLARFLRNPAIAGRRMNKEGKTVLRYDGIIEWNEHLAIVKRLDSRAHRKGISPANTYLLTGIISCDAGHAMYGIKGGSGIYRYTCRYCRFGAPLELADAEVNRMVLDIFGTYPYMIRRIVPGNNHFEEIAKLRQDRNELDDLANDYDVKHAALTAEIRRLTNLDKEHPEPDRIEWVFSGKLIAQHWASLSTGQRRDWLKENGWKVTVSRLESGHVNLAIDPNGTAERGFEAAAASIGWPVEELSKGLLRKA
jgi:DNA invertase Pin-like site-specific DNA recombinase